MSLRLKLFLIFLTVAMVGVITVNVFVNFFLESLFQEYAIRKQEDKNAGVRELIENQYLDGRWNTQVIQDIGVSVLEEGMILHVKDLKKKDVWNAVDYNSGICQDMIQQMTFRMTSRYPSVKGGLTHQEYPLLVHDKAVGTMVIGYYGPFYYTEADLFFIDTINNLLFYLTIILFITSFILAYFFSRAISYPIQKVSLAAIDIAKGSYDHRVEVVTSTREINELIQSINNLSEHLYIQEKLRKRLTQDIAHELRTPLTTLQGQIEAYLDGVWELDVDRLKSTHEEILRLSALVKDLELLSHYDAETMKLELTRENLNDLMLHVLQSFEPALAEKEIYLEYTEHDLEIMTDKHKLCQVFSNLLSNSLKYTPQGGKIIIQIIREKKYCKILFRDTGIGISEKHLAHVFERFYRVDPSRTRVTGGSGIGLAICKEIVKALKGEISISSEEGKGTLVRMIFPINLE